MREVAAGLREEEARRCLAEVGPNEPAPPRPFAPLLEVVLLFTNPLVVLLLIASAVSAAVGEIVSAGIIASIVILSVTLNAVQTLRSHRAAEHLRLAVALTASVLRDGAWCVRPRRELVPGDVIRLAAGDLVPADARLLTARDLHVQQAALTGESLPVEKEAGPLAPDEKSPASLRLVFLGTSVASGTATAEVVATGPRTSFGAIAARLAARPPETEFERGTRHFGLLIARTVLFLVVFVLFVNVLQKRELLPSLLFAIALAVGLTPEFLPMITAVTLAKGARRMAERKVIVKQLQAIQNLGSVDILVSDKTGTLTSGEMQLASHVDAFGRPSERIFRLAYLNSFFETGISNPLDAAILRHETLDAGAYRKLDEVPFDFERRRLSIVVEGDGERLLITKGAPEGILPLCVAAEKAGEAVPLPPERRAECETVVNAAHEEGFRVLAVARRAVEEREAYRASDEVELVLVGFLMFRDPPLEEARTFLEALRKDEVEVKMLTGDNDLVARHVAREVGLDVTRVVTGDELDRMTDSALGHVAETASVFARISPAQKGRVIMALKGRGHVVGFFGDGINDAPSLRAADVGISAVNAVEVAKDAADVILVEKGLDVIHVGILEGRKAFGNVMKYLLMGTSSNFGNMFSMAGAALFLPFLPMLPTQILLNNFLYDMAQVTIPSDSVDPTFTRKPRHWDVALIRDFMLFIGPLSSIYDFLTFFVLLRVFHSGEELFHTGWFVESLATQTLVIFVIRTAGNPFKSRPSRALAITALSVVAIGVLLPYSPLAAPFGFVGMPASFLFFLLAASVTYLMLVELAKRRLMRRLT